MASSALPLHLTTLSSSSPSQPTFCTICNGGKFLYKHPSNTLSPLSNRIFHRNRTSNGSLTVISSHLNNSPIISPDDQWGMWTALFATGTFGLWSEKTKIGSMVSAALVSILVGLAASNLGIIPHDAPAYSVVFQYLLPLTIPLLLFRADLRQVVRTTGTLFLAFLLGSVATIVGTTVAFLMVPMRSLGQDNWKIAAALMGSYIGGGMKRFKEANPELFPKPEPTAPKDPNKKKNKNSKFKRKKSEPNDPNKPKKSSYKKHPLRVAGMKPGESCFICKALDHIAKLCPNKSEWERNKTCLFCRQRGHNLKNCPNKNDESTDKKLCYNCGEMGHSLANCPQPLQEGGTRYANCFICNESGHLSKNCPKNTHGIYPKGGSCKICGGITHLARDCPNKHSRISANMGGQSFEGHERPNRITKFVSGDDLEDDFLSVVPQEEKDKDVKSKKKQGPKVVNFVA